MAGEYDTVIVGAGPAGLSAAIYACRRKMKTVVVAEDVGGQTNLASSIENYPGADAMPGMQLMQRFFSQAKCFGCVFVRGVAVKIKKAGKLFTVELGTGEKLTGKTVILAYGKTPRKLGAPGEEKFIGKGISTCATCDGMLFKGKSVAVVGGGNAALDAALFLSKVAKAVHLIHRRADFRGDELMVERVKKEAKNVQFILESVVTEFRGDKFLKSIMIAGAVGKKTELIVDGVFMEIGYVVDSDWVKGTVKVNEANEICIDSHNRTSQEGIFAAGDVTNVPYKQAIVAAGEGAKAALEAYNFVYGYKYGTASIDWMHTKEK